MKKTLPITLALAIGLATAATAQTVQQNAGDQSPVNITLGEEIDLAALVDLCATCLALNIEYDVEQMRKTRLTLRLRGSVTKDELWDLTNRLLAAYGWTTVTMSGDKTLSVVKLTDAGRHSRFVDSMATDNASGFAATVRRIDHASPEAVLAAIRPLLSQPGGAAARLGTTDFILLSDLRPRLTDIMAMIDDLDQQHSDANVRILRIPTKFVDAAQLVSQVSAAVIARDSIAPRPLRGKVVAATDGVSLMLVSPGEEVEIWNGLIAECDALEPVISRTYTPNRFGIQEVAALLEKTAKSPLHGSGDRWRVVVDDLTASLIVTATPAEHEQVEQVLQRLESAPGHSRRVMRIFTLRNRPAAEVLELCRGLFAADTRLWQSTATESASGSIQPAPDTDLPQRSLPEVPRATSPNAASEDAEILFNFDEATNSIVAIGEPRALERVAELIDLLDTRQSQVHITVLIASLNDSEALDLGVELQKLELSGNALIGLSSLFGLSDITPDSKSPLGIGRGFSGVVLSPGDFSVVIRALQALNKGTSQTVPQLLVANHEQATFDSVLQQPLLEINASNAVATTSFAGTLDAGTQVTITPHISEGDALVLEYNIALSAFTGESSDPTLPPPRQETRVQSVVTIPDGYTIVVGGMDAESDSTATSQVPLLGDIPGLGELFKRRSRSGSRSRFYVFIRGDIMRHSGFEDLRHLSRTSMKAADVQDHGPLPEPRIIR